MRWKEIITERYAENFDPWTDGLTPEFVAKIVSHAPNRQGADEAEFRLFCEQRVRQTYADIHDRIRGGSLRIWRAITLPEGEVPDESRYPGVCWTYDEDAIHPAHGSLNDHIWVYSAETTTDQIDWATTLAQHIWFDDEKEIRLIDWGHVEVLEITDTGETK